MEMLTYSKNLLEYRQFLSVTIDHFPTIQAKGSTKLAWGGLF